MDEEERAAIDHSRRFGMPYASFENKILKAESWQKLEKLVPEATARENSIFPLFVDVDADVLAVAVTNPEDVLALDRLKESTGFEIQPFIARKTQLDKAIDDFYRR